MAVGIGNNKRFTGNAGTSSPLRMGLMARCVALVALALALSAWVPGASAQTYSYVAQWGGLGGGDGQFWNPQGVAVDGSGTVYVADTFNHRIQKFTSSGVFVIKWGSMGTGDGQLAYPTGVTVDASGNVYVADQNNHRIQKFTSSGTFITKWGSSGSGDGQLRYPYGVAVDGSGTVYVADFYNYRIQKFTPDGTFVTKWGSYGSGDGQFIDSSCLAVDGSGNVYVGDWSSARIQKFTPEGIFVTKWGSLGTGDGQFDVPLGVAVDGSGNVYVADMHNDRVQKFTSSGTFITKWGSSGSGDGQFNDTLGVAVDGSGKVYVADMSNHRIQVFALNLPAPVITSPNGGADDSTNSLPVILSGTCDSATPAIHVNGSATGVTYTSGAASWSYTSDALVSGANLFTVTAYNGVAESTADAITITLTPPAVTLSSAVPSPTDLSAIPVTVTFSAPVTGFTADDITVTNGTVTNFLGSGTTYTFDIAPTGPGLITASVNAGVADGAGGANLAAGSSFEVTYTPPPMPVAWWPVALSLLAAGLMVLRRGTRRNA